MVSKRFFRFLIAGSTSAALNIGLYSLLLYGTHTWYITAAVASSAVGIITSFTLQKYWTFKKRSGSVTLQALSYLAFALFNLAINAYLLFLLVETAHVAKLPANIISNGIIAIWSYFLYKYFIFK